MTIRPDGKLTYDDYVHFPEGQRWELLDGQAHVAPTPNVRHQVIVGNLLLQLHHHLENHGGGKAIQIPFDVVLTDTDVVQPDFVVIADRDMGGLNEENFRGTPTWMIEILCDPIRERDREDKHRIYERTGVPEYWIIDPDEETVEVYRLEGACYREPTIHVTPASVPTDSLPGLAIDLVKLFGGWRPS